MTQRILELELHTICGGQLCVNVLHFMGDTTEVDMFKLAKDMVNAIDTPTGSTTFTANEYMSPLSGACFLSALVARVVGALPGSKYPKLYAPADFPGGQSGEIYAQSVAANIKLVTASGPDFTGRVFLPGVPEDMLLRNRWDPDYVVLINTWRAAYEGGVEVGAVQFLPVVYKASTMTAEAVTNTALSPNPGTIRRRLSPY